LKASAAARPGNQAVGEGCVDAREGGSGVGQPLGMIDAKGGQEILRSGGQAQGDEGVDVTAHCGNFDASAGAVPQGVVESFQLLVI